MKRLAALFALVVGYLLFRSKRSRDESLRQVPPALTGVDLLKSELEAASLSVWPSLSGFGVATAWPDPKYRTQIETIKELVAKHLPDSWAAHGPTMAAGGVIVLFVWPKEEPHPPPAATDVEAWEIHSFPMNA